MGAPMPSPMKRKLASPSELLNTPSSVPDEHVALRHTLRRRDRDREHSSISERDDGLEARASVTGEMEASIGADHQKLAPPEEIVHGGIADLGLADLLESAAAILAAVEPAGAAHEDLGVDHEELREHDRRQRRVREPPFDPAPVLTEILAEEQPSSAATKSCGPGQAVSRTAALGDSIRVHFVPPSVER